ncbi:hypothetical protein K466DRAFT_182493 [Polyporus arcularius HHB13444]|uniref:Uncharacterized protein n=1 Tax=Polyporus arcularius HHB13444 TaxID=1314778 RepID=A0A5C3PYJ4_9APHY|nr:hypothetical protein K466DRAFT_182493 [Polyporus arcularius HHB13444]
MYAATASTNPSTSGLSALPFHGWVRDVRVSEDSSPTSLEWSGSSTLCSTPKSTASTEYDVYASVRHGVHLSTGHLGPPCCHRTHRHDMSASLTSCVFPIIPTASQPPQIALRPSTDSRSHHDSQQCNGLVVAHGCPAPADSSHPPSSSRRSLPGRVPLKCHG